MVDQDQSIWLKVSFALGKGISSFLRFFAGTESFHCTTALAIVGLEVWNGLILTMRLKVKSLHGVATIPVVHGSLHMLLQR